MLVLDSNLILLSIILDAILSSVAKVLIKILYNINCTKIFSIF